MPCAQPGIKDNLLKFWNVKKVIKAQKIKTRKIICCKIGTRWRVRDHGVTQSSACNNSELISRDDLAIAKKGLTTFCPGGMKKTFSHWCVSQSLKSNARLIFLLIFFVSKPGDNPVVWRQNGSLLLSPKLDLERISSVFTDCKDYALPRSCGNGCGNNCGNV